MNKKEIDRLIIITQIEENKITVLEAAELLALTQRQIYWILKRIRAEGVKEIIVQLYHESRMGRNMRIVSQQ